LLDAIDVHRRAAFSASISAASVSMSAQIREAAAARVERWRTMTPEQRACWLIGRQFGESSDLARAFSVYVKTCASSPAEPPTAFEAVA